MSLLIGWTRRRLTIFEAWPFLQCCAMQSIMATHIISTKARHLSPPPPPLRYWSRIILRQKKRNKRAVMIFICETQAQVDAEQARIIKFHLWLRLLWIHFYFLPSFRHESSSPSKQNFFFCSFFCLDSWADNEKVPIREVPVSCGERSFWQVSYFHTGFHQQHAVRAAKLNHPTARAKHN